MVILLKVHLFVVAVSHFRHHWAAYVRKNIIYDWTISRRWVWSDESDKTIARTPLQCLIFSTTLGSAIAKDSEMVMCIFIEPTRLNQVWTNRTWTVPFICQLEKEVFHESNMWPQLTLHENTWIIHWNWLTRDTFSVINSYLLNLNAFQGFTSI